MNNMTPIEKKNKKKGRNISIIIHAILLLLAFFVSIDGIPRNPEPMYEVAVNFTFEPSSNSTKSQSSSGAERAKVKDVTEIEQHQAKEIEVEVPKPEVQEVEIVKANPTPSDPIVSDIVDEDETEVVAVEEEVDIEDPEEDVVPDPEPDPTPDKIIKKGKTTKTPSTKGGGSKTGKDSKESSASNNKNGTGTGKGDKGSGKGSDKTGNDNDSGKGKGGVGTGEYDGSGDGVFGRKVVYVNRKYNFTLQGRMTIKICIDRNGNVLTCSIIEEETTVTNRDVLRKALKLIKGYKFEKDMSAPREQCGKTKLTVDDKRKGTGGQTLSFW